MSTRDRKDVDKQVAASIKKFSQLAKDDPNRDQYIVMPESVQQKAELISAHFLLPSGSKLANMGCRKGEMTYVLAQLRPDCHLIGIDTNPENIEFARNTYKLPNLSYILSDSGVPDMDDASLDGIINSNILHGVYSEAGYNPDEVGHFLQKQVRKLKPGGFMLIRDYMLPSEREFVMLELPNVRSKGKDPMQLSDADLLLSFSHTARPLLGGGAEGFPIEELQPRRLNTRLFRLPHKWALEFIYHKDYRINWKNEIKEEFTFFTWEDYARECSKIGLRVVFSSPYWNPWIVENRFKGLFQLYTDDYRPMGNPPTNNFIVTQRVADKQSLLLEERRPSQAPVGDLKVIVVRDKRTGILHELIKRPGEFCDIVPYRITPDNRLIVYVHSGYPRPIINATSRGRHNLDGKKWSGHLIEPITMATVSMSDDIEANRQMIFDYVGTYASLRPKSDESWHVGDTYFPAPDQIDEAIEAVFVEVENPAKTTWAINSDKESVFTEIGMITELDATNIVLASQVGLLPEPRLELHVLALMRRYGIMPPKWIGEVMPKLARMAITPVDPDELVGEVGQTEFEEEKSGAPARLKPVKAVFVEEGKVGHVTRGLTVQEIEYIVTDDGIENIAIVLPITKDWDNNLLVALDPKIMPVPNRLGGDGATLNAPSFPLPKGVQTVDEAKAFVASKFKVQVEQVSQLGASFFTHVGVMPQRVYPFTVASAVEADTSRVLRYAMIDALLGWIYLHREHCMSGATLKLISRTQMRNANWGHGMYMTREDKLLKYKGFSLSTEKVAVEATHAGYSAVPSRILGERGTMEKVVAAVETAEVVHHPDRKLGVKEGATTTMAGRRLSHSYAQAKLQVRETDSIIEVDRSIEEIGRALPKIKPVLENQ